MATYVIGDVHGCLGTLEALFARLPFDAATDRLWMVGDLVNRGPDSAGVLRWARGKERELGERFVAVLGNHDIHLLARVDGTDPRSRDTLDGVLAAPDRSELIDWLYGRPLLHRDGDVVLVHAGLLPHWSVDEAAELAREVEDALRAPGAKRLLDRYAVPPRRWRSDFSPAASGATGRSPCSPSFGPSTATAPPGETSPAPPGRPPRTRCRGTRSPTARAPTTPSSSATGPPSACASPRACGLSTPAASGASG